MKATSERQRMIVATWDIGGLRNRHTFFSCPCAVVMDTVMNAAFSYDFFCRLSSIFKELSPYSYHCCSYCSLSAGSHTSPLLFRSKKL